MPPNMDKLPVADNPSGDKFKKLSPFHKEILLEKCKIDPMMQKL